MINRSLFYNPRLTLDASKATNSSQQMLAGWPQRNRKMNNSQIIEHDYNQESSIGEGQTNEEYGQRRIEPPILYKGGMFGQKGNVGILKKQKRYKMPEVKTTAQMKIVPNDSLGHDDLNAAMRADLKSIDDTNRATSASAMNFRDKAKI